jgi:D-amino-acid dehydrogenase
MEPALIPIASQLAGAIHYPGDAMGDAYKFCNQLAERAHLLGVRFLYVTAATKLRLADRKVTGLMCDAEEFVADQYVVCAGSWSNVLLRTVGVHLPIRPAKGYSVTLENPPTNVATSLRIPVVDDQLHAVVTPLEGAVRVAGTAEFAGYNVDINPQRVRNLLGLLSKVLPEQPFNLETAKPWCGLRPMTSDGVPLIGRTTIENLWVNSGHGHLGWTMATGSARLLSDLICNKCLPMDAKPYSPARFLQHKRGMNRDFH